MSGTDILRTYNNQSIPGINLKKFYIEGLRVNINAELLI